MSLAENLRLAQEAIAYARKIIQQSSSLPEIAGEDLKTLKERVEEIRNKSVTKENKLKLLFSGLEDKAILDLKTHVKKTKQEHIGNCNEYSFLVLNYLRKQSPVFAEVVHILDGDHVFVIIGRDPKSNINDPTTWGPDAVICDAWAKQYYPATEMATKMQCYVFDVQNMKNILYPYLPGINQLHVENTLDHRGDGAVYAEKIQTAKKTLSLLFSATNALLREPKILPVLLQTENKETKDELEKLKQDLMNANEALAKGYDNSLSPIQLSRQLAKQNRQFYKTFLKCLSTLGDPIKEFYINKMHALAKQNLMPKAVAEPPKSLAESKEEAYLAEALEEEDVAEELLDDADQLAAFTPRSIYLILCNYEEMYKKYIIEQPEPKIIEKLIPYLPGLHARFAYLRAAPTSASIVDVSATLFNSATNIGTPTHRKRKKEEAQPAPSTDTSQDPPALPRERRPKHKL